jgi:hypothetical protein
MATDLTHHIQSIRLVDTHEHMKRGGNQAPQRFQVVQQLIGQRRNLAPQENSPLA